MPKLTTSNILRLNLSKQIELPIYWRGHLQIMKLNQIAYIAYHGDEYAKHIVSACKIAIALHNITDKSIDM